MILQSIALLLTKVSPGGLPTPNADSHAIQVILGIVFGIIGGIALLMATISGLRYITSGGDPQKAANARNGLIFALVGLLIALSAEAIVAFVLGYL